ncbi:MAG: hypothetical protein GY896_24750 [Gammaproteobacteria bacterium]|nr:hypothetical protein [Gammaproteobacteria bacterium]
MIRYINCVRRRQDISVEAFRRHWNSPEFEALLERAIDIMKAERFAKNLALEVSATRVVRDDRGTGEPFDGTLEFWWRDAHDLMEKYESPEAQKIREEMQDYQERFVDIGGCRAFFTEYEAKDQSR